ncbi:MAG: ABC transporter substrate-binding protein [Verrucomicrobia bacterium]|nr:ABC transporter substrate-binding protein [Verrucomicrobiota bacterium]
MDPKKTKKRRVPLATTLIENFGLNPAVATAIASIFIAVVLAAVVWIIRSAPPRTIVITSGPAGSSFERYAQNYQKILAKHGVTLVILPSNGSIDNLQRLQDPTAKVDIGFVQGGMLPKDTVVKGLVSLGSIAYQPLWVYYRNPTPITRLSELQGKRIAVGPVGSGTRALATALLTANGVTNAAPTVFSEQDSTAAAADLLAGKVDAVFMMGDSASTKTLVSLGRAADVQMFNFAQADAYVRRFSYLNKMTIPEGVLDLGKNLPAKDVELVAPMLELVARDGLNPAMSDLLLSVAQEVHGKAGFTQKRGEFPAPLEHEFPLSEDAQRYYKSGKSFLYRMIDNFWLASLLNRILVAVVPLALVLIPTIKFFPFAYRFRIQLKIYKCYRPLLRLEREAQDVALTKEDAQELLKRLDEIEHSVNHLKVPASFASAFYELRGHVAFVRRRLQGVATAPEMTP